MKKKSTKLKSNFLRIGNKALLKVAPYKDKSMDFIESNIVENVKLAQQNINALRKSVVEYQQYEKMALEDILKLPNKYLGGLNDQSTQDLKEFHIFTHYRQGLVYYRQKRWSEALRCFQKAYRYIPNYPPNTFKLGLCYLKVKELHEAQFYLKKAVEQAPHNQHWQEQLKQCERQLESTSDAHASSVYNTKRVRQGAFAQSLGISLKKKLLLVPSDYNHRVMADISSFIKYYKDDFEIYIILRALDDDIIYKSTHTLIKNGTSYGEFLKFTADYVIDAGTMNYSYRITDTTKWVSVWHGIPYKKMFVDLDVKNLNTAIRYGLAYDCMISMSDFYTDTFLRKAMRYDGEILQIGCAKTDNLFEIGETKKRVECLYKTLGIPSDKKVVLYAPDFRHETQIDLPFNANALLRSFGNQYCLLVLLPSQYHSLNEINQENVYCINELDEIDAIAIADILLSDYNSLINAFDQYNKPVALFHYDFDEFLADNPNRRFALNVLARRQFVAKTTDELLALDWKKLQAYAQNFELPTDMKLSLLKGSFGIPEDKKVILYAPTFRKAGEVTLPFNPDVLNEQLNNEYVIITKMHYLNHLKVQFNNVIDCTSYSEIADLMKLADILISDYSSLVLDFALLNKPIILYQYDYSEYMAQRGVYFDFEEYLPSAQIVKSESELYSLDWMDLSYDNKKLIENFYPLEDGNSTQRIVEAINFKAENRHSKDIVFLVNELNQIGGVHSFLKNMAKYYKQRYNARIFVIAIKEFAESNSEFHLLESPYIDYKLSSQYLGGACANILQNTDGIVISLQFSAHIHFQKYLSGAKSVLMFHGDVKDVVSREIYTWHLDAINRGKVYNYQKFLVLTESAVELLRPELDVDIQPKLGFIHNSIDADYCPLPRNDSRATAVISRLDADKNVFAMIDLGKEILAQGQDIVVNIYGDGALKEDFLMAIEKNALQDILKVRGFEGDKQKIFSENGSLLLMSKSEGFPLVVLEAYAYGRPVIVFDSFTAAKDIVLHGQTGYLLPYGDYQGVIGAVEGVKTISQDGIRALFDQFSNQAVFDQWDKLIYELDVQMQENGENQ